MNILKLVLFLLLFLISFRVSAQDYINDDTKNICDTANVFVRATQTVSGVNFISSQILANSLENSITEYVKGDINFKINSYSLSDLKRGVLKGISIKAKNLIVDSICLSEFKAKTKCNCVVIDTQTKPIRIKSPIVADFSVKFSAEDLNKILKTTAYKNYFVKIKHNNYELNLFEISQPKVSIKDNKFIFGFLVKMPFLRNLKVKIKSDLAIIDNQIIIREAIIDTRNLRLKISNEIISKLNPLSFIQTVLQEYDCKILLKNVKILKEKVVIDGSFFLQNNKENK